MQLPILNLREARFECTFGRGCEGICCRDGRPPVYAPEVARIQSNLPLFLPLMRPEAVALVGRSGFMSRRRKDGANTLRVVSRWCVFFNKGCVLQRAGLDGGDKHRFKPFVCAVFPLEKHPTKGWYVRQKGFMREGWDLFCLNPAESRPPAASSLGQELALINRYPEY